MFPSYSKLLFSTFPPSLSHSLSLCLSTYDMSFSFLCCISPLSSFVFAVCYSSHCLVMVWWRDADGDINLVQKFHHFLSSFFLFVSNSTVAPRPCSLYPATLYLPCLPACQAAWLPPSLGSCSKRAESLWGCWPGRWPASCLRGGQGNVCHGWPQWTAEGRREPRGQS